MTAVHLSSVNTDYSFSNKHTVKGKSQNCRVIGGLAQPQKRTVGVRLTCGFSRGAHFIASAPGRRKPIVTPLAQMACAVVKVRRNAGNAVHGPLRIAGERSQAPHSR